MLSIDDRRPFPPCSAPFSLARHVLWQNGAPDDKIALAILSTAGAERWSYGRLRAAVLETAGGLLAAGLAEGDRLILRLGNTADFPVVFLAAVAAGVIPVPTSAALTDAEFARLAGQIAARGIIAAPELTVDGLASLPPEALRAGPPLAKPGEGDPERPAYIVFTSGTSGRPLGVVHAHRAIWARQAMIAHWYDLTASDRMLHAGAFNWTYTLGTGLFDPWSVGATALVPAAGTEAALFPLLMKRHDATIFAASPGIFRQILRQKLPTLPKLRHALSAGEKLPETLRARWRGATGTDIHEAFGQCECSTFLSGGPRRPAPPGTLGFAQPGRAVAILGPDGPVPRGEEGDIAIAGDDPGLMLGYLDAPEDSAERQRGGWTVTGDRGAMTEDGAITYLGRSDDILTAGGFRISPIEIEAAMLALPGIEDAAAVDERLDGETFVVALHYAADAPLPEAALTEHAARHLARYKQPRRFHHHASLPRGSGGKLLRRLLRTATDGSP